MRMTVWAAVVAVRRQLKEGGWSKTRAGLLFSTTLAAAFSVGFTAVAAMPPIALALALVYTRTASATKAASGEPADFREAARAHAELTLGFALAHIFAYAGLMQAYNSPSLLIIASFVLSALSVAPFAASYAVSKRFALLDSAYSTLIFPLFWTACFATWSELGSVGTWGSWAYSLSPVGANIGGMPFVDFLLAWGSSLAADIISGERRYYEVDDECPLCSRRTSLNDIRRTRTITDDDHPRVLNDDEGDANGASEDDEEARLLRPVGDTDVRVLACQVHECGEELLLRRKRWKRQAYAWLAVFLTAVFLAEFRVLPRTVAVGEGTRPYPSDVPGRISIGCAMAETDDEADPMVENLLRTSRTLATKGAKLVLWSEAAVRVTSTEEREDLFRRVGEVTAKHGISVAMSFLETFRSPLDSKGRNVLSVVGPDGTVLLEQEKAHPVPLVESYHVRAAREGMKVRHIPGIGNVGAAICHDLDHPSVFRRADPSIPDLVLQPAATWTGVGDRHFEMAAFRAVETGVAVFRCDAKGTGGYVDGKGNVIHLHQRQTAEALPPKGQVHSFLVDHMLTPRRSWTVYSAVGDMAITVILDLVAGIVLIALALPAKALAWIERARYGHPQDAVVVFESSGSRGRQANEYVARGYHPLTVTDASERV